MSTRLVKNFVATWQSSSLSHIGHVARLMPKRQRTCFLNNSKKSNVNSIIINQSTFNLISRGFVQHQQGNSNNNNGYQKINNKMMALVLGLGIGVSLLLNYDSGLEVKAQEEIKEPIISQSIVRVEESINRYEIEDDVNILREILKGKSKDEFNITIYQYQVCPFCCKVRAYLDFHQIPYKMIEVNPLFKSEIKFSKDYRKVPIVVIDNYQLNDSSRIITHLNDILDETNMMNSKDTVKWRKWVDDTFVHTLAPNIYRTNEEAVEAFEYISEQNGFSWFQKQAVLYGGSFTMYAVSNRLKKKYGIENEREALFYCGRKWINEAVLPNGRFHGVDKPDLADLAAYGILSSIEGLRTFNELTKEVPQLGAWYDMMKRTVPKCSGVKINK